MEDSAFPGRLASNGLADGGAKLRGLRTILRQSFREGANEVAIGVKPENFEAGQTALGQALPVVLDRALL